MDSTKIRRTFPLEIPLPSKPRDYRSGDGPALAPIRLSLENDDTGAFIIDKHVIPHQSGGGDLKLDLFYVVGWPDLPAAGVAILATKILDYVSPRTLEDWEFKHSLEKDEAKNKHVPAKRLKQDKRARDNKTGTLTEVIDASSSAEIDTDKSIPGSPKQKRASKANTLARQVAEQSDFAVDELASVPVLPPTSTKRPSLSSSKKNLARLAPDTDETEEMEEMEETDMNTTLPEQFCADSDDDIDLEAAGEPEDSEETTDGLDFTSLSSFLPTPSFQGHAQFRSPNTPSSIHPDVTPCSSLGIPIRSSPKKRRSLLAPSLTTPGLSYQDQSGRKKALKPPPKVSPVPAPSHAFTRPKMSQQQQQQQQRTVTETPVPAPKYPIPTSKPGPSHKPGLSQNEATTSSTTKPEIPHTMSFTPVPVPSYPHLDQERSKKHVSSKKLRRVSTTDIPPPSKFLSDETTGSDEPTGFTPIGRHNRGKETTRVKSEPEFEHDIQTRAPSKSVTPATKAGSGSGRKRKRTQPDSEPEWEVKRLEGDRVIETGGELVRYFKVRWEGKWPPGQNPTWEPEELIPQDIVRKYLKSKASKVVKGGSPAGRPSRQLQTPTMERKYANVAEAFAGDVE